MKAVFVSLIMWKKILKKGEENFLFLVLVSQEAALNQFKIGG